MLERDPSKRIGAKRDTEMGEFKRLSWFKNMDWELLESKQMTPLLIPDVRTVSGHRAVLSPVRLLTQFPVRKTEFRLVT